MAGAASTRSSTGRRRHPRRAGEVDQLAPDGTVHVRDRWRRERGRGRARDRRRPQRGVAAGSLTSQCLSLDCSTRSVRPVIPVVLGGGTPSSSRSVAGRPLLDGPTIRLKAHTSPISATGEAADKSSTSFRRNGRGDRRRPEPHPEVAPPVSGAADAQRRASCRAKSPGTRLCGPQQHGRERHRPARRAVDRQVELRTGLALVGRPSAAHRQTASCPIHHLGYSVSGLMRVRMDDGQTLDIGPDTAYEIPAGHDAWVVGRRAVGDRRVDELGRGRRRCGGLGHRRHRDAGLHGHRRSTALAERLGPSRMARPAVAAQRSVRQVLNAFHGREVKTTATAS